MAAYCDACSDWMEYVKHPEPSFTDCSDWNSQFANWLAVNFWIFVISGAIWIIWGLVEGCNCLAKMFPPFAVGIATCFILAHFAYFCVVREGGCIHPICCVVVGILLIIHGLNWANLAASGDFKFPYGVHLAPSMAHDFGENGDYVRMILYGAYAVSLLYCGVAAIMVCVSGQAGDSDFVSRHIEVDDLEELGAASQRRGLKNGRRNISTADRHERPAERELLVAASGADSDEETPLTGRCEDMVGEE